MNHHQTSRIDISWIEEKMTELKFQLQRLRKSAFLHSRSQDKNKNKKNAFNHDVEVTGGSPDSDVTV